MTWYAIKPLPGCSVVGCCLFLETPTHLKEQMRIWFLLHNSYWRVGKAEAEAHIPRVPIPSGKLAFNSKTEIGGPDFESRAVMHPLYTCLGK